MLRSLLIVLVFFGPFAVFAQDVQQWQVIRSEKFTVFYNEPQQVLAADILHYLDEEFIRVSDMVGYPAYRSVHVYLLDADEDVSKRAVILSDSMANMENPAIVVSADSLNTDVRRELVYEFSKIIINEMLYSPGVLSMYDEDPLKLPDWFVEGAAMYLSSGGNAGMDKFIAENIQSIEPDELDMMQGMEAYLAGQTLWNFMAEAYSSNTMANIMNYTRIVRNKEKAVMVTVGLSYEEVLQDWKNFYTVNSDVVNEEK